MQQIGQFSLNNDCPYVVELQFIYINEEGEPVHVGGTGGYPISQSETADPGKYGVPEGSRVALYVSMKMGPHKQATQWFQYASGSSVTANYTISGTTLFQNLVLDSVA